MKRKRFLILGVLSVIFLLTSCGPRYNLPLPPTSIPLANSQISDDVPINLPGGFEIEVFAEKLVQPKMMAFGPDNNLYITEYGTGRVLKLPDKDNDGVADQIDIVAEGLIEPSGLAFYNDGSLYVAETTRVIKFSEPDKDGLFQERDIIIAGIPAGGFTNRTIIFSPDGKRLFLSVGASCNVCIEEDKRRASILMLKPDGRDPIIYVKGLRYVVGLAFHPTDETLWAANIGREGLQDGYPPDSIYTLYIEKDAGWPYCHAGKIIDPEYGDKNSCSDDILQPRFNLESQTVPYGIEFYNGSQFPEEYRDNLFIALHGSGEGLKAKGFKIIRKPIGDVSNKAIRDFATGWVSPDGTPWGAPTDIIQGPDGSLYLSDDLQGVIYRIFYAGAEGE